MKIGLVIYGSLDILSGGYLYDRRLVEELTRQGDEVSLISLPWRRYPFCLTESFSGQTLRRLETLDVDALLEDELTHPSLFRVNRQLKQHRGFPIVGIIHHLRVQERHPQTWMRLYRAVELDFLTSLDAIICNSSATWQAVEKVSYRRFPTVVAHPAADHFAMQARIEETIPPARATLRLLFVGNIIPRKGLGVLLEALSELRDGNWSLTVAGSLDFDPVYARSMQTLARRLLPEQKFTFTGRVADETLLALYRRHDALVVPSVYEGFGIVYLEAMRQGLAPIGTTGGGAGEIITTGQDGYLIAPGDAHSLTLILKDWMETPESLAGMKRRAVARALAFPSWQETAANVRAFLVELIKSHSGVKSDV